MTFCEFQTTTHGKWILAGEHAVLRGHGALVFPVREKKLTLTYQPSASSLHADYAGSSGDDMHVLFWSVLEQGQHLLGQSLNQLSGHFHLESNIPVGVGMGASAALCVAMARWFATQQLLSHEHINDFAKQLENLFHGKSSGLDIAGVAANSGMYFEQGIATPLEQAWQPIWRLSSCGQIGVTSHCINQVAALWQTDEAQGREIDLTMKQAADKARHALTCHSNSALQQLTEAVEEGHACFKAWGLISDTLKHHIALLRAHGALAAKPTGSGGGGYVLSLWDKAPARLPFELIQA